MEKHLLAAESWRGSACWRETAGIGEERFANETKPHGPPLCRSRLQAGLHGCHFLATKSLLLQSEMTRKVPKASPGVHGEKQPPPGVGSEQEPSGSALSGTWQSPEQACSAVSCKDKSSLSFTLGFLKQRLQRGAQGCLHPNPKGAKAVTVIAVGVSLWSHLVGIKGRVHQQEALLEWSLGRPARKNNESLW